MFQLEKKKRKERTKGEKKGKDRKGEKVRTSIGWHYANRGTVRHHVAIGLRYCNHKFEYSNKRHHKFLILTITDTLELLLGLLHFSSVEDKALKLY